MTAAQRAPFSNRAIVNELFMEAKIDALNTKPIEEGISADRVIAILPVEAQVLVKCHATAVSGVLPPELRFPGL